MLVCPVPGALRPAGRSHLHPAPFLASPATDSGPRASAAEPSARLSLFVAQLPLSHRVAPGAGGPSGCMSLPCSPVPSKWKTSGVLKTRGSWDSHIFVSPILLASEAKWAAVERGR